MNGSASISTELTGKKDVIDFEKNFFNLLNKVIFVIYIIIVDIFYYVVQ